MLAWTGGAAAQARGFKLGAELEAYGGRGHLAPGEAARPVYGFFPARPAESPPGPRRSPLRDAAAPRPARGAGGLDLAQLDLLGERLTKPPAAADPAEA